MLKEQLQHLLLTSSGYHSLDRFRTSYDTAGTWTQSQSTDVPTGQGFAKSLKMDCTTANGSLSAGSFLAIQSKFEGQNLQYLKKRYIKCRKFNFIILGKIE